jgi:hypothetical protein
VASNAWERAQDAIAHASRRATERDESVITPDTAVSPFDASTTTVLPHALAARGGAPPDPDLTQRLPQADGRGDRDGRGGRDGHRRGTADTDPDDPRTVRFEVRRGPSHPGTSPFPASPFPPDEGRGHDETRAQDPARRSWWRRLFRR